MRTLRSDEQSQGESFHIVRNRAMVKKEVESRKCGEGGDRWSGQVEGQAGRAWLPLGRGIQRDP